MSDNADSTESRSKKAYGEMLLRQYPWMRDILRADETPMAVSFRNADWLHGIVMLFLGGLCVVDPLLHLSSYPSIVVAAALLIGLGLIWAGIWLIRFRKRSYVIVTENRVLYRKMNPFGKDGKLMDLDRAEIKRVRYLKSTVMYRIGRKDGAVAVYLKNGKTIVISDVRDGENTFTSIR